VGSIEKSVSEHEFNGRKYVVERGEFAEYLAEMNSYLEQALPYVANET
jgi:hypothetical protein